MSIDTLEVNACDAIPSCQIPDMVEVSGITTGEATISWNDLNNPASLSYELEILDIDASEVADGSVDFTSTTTSFDITVSDYILLPGICCL